MCCEGAPSCRACLGPVAMQRRMHACQRRRRRRMGIAEPHRRPSLAPLRVLPARRRHRVCVQHAGRCRKLPAEMVPCCMCRLHMQLSAAIACGHACVSVRLVAALPDQSCFPAGLRAHFQLRFQADPCAGLLAQPGEPLAVLWWRRWWSGCMTSTSVSLKSLDGT